MPKIWFALKRSLRCKSEPSDVHDPKARTHLPTFLTKKIGRSVENLKDVIHGSKRHSEKLTIHSPRSIGSSECINPITHEVILSNSRCELKITSFRGCKEGGVGAGEPNFLGTLKPGTPGPGGHYNASFRPASTPSRKFPSFDREGFALGGSADVSSRASSLNVDSQDSSIVTCHKCGAQFGKWEAAEEHHLTHHAVTELTESDSSRKIVETICRSSWLKAEDNCGPIERILKVHNMQKTLARFEEYREMVKIKAGKLPKKHPRCLADGNELLRFYGTTMACPLGMNGTSNLCMMEKCIVCRIIRNGFSAKEEGIGIFTTCTSGRALESVQVSEEEASMRKALLVCRVIAGRVHRPLDEIQQLVGQSGFDSLAGKVGLYSNIEELYLFNPRALLPCFVVICKP